MLDDLQLIKFASEGRLEAFEALISKYKDRVYNIAFAFTGNCAESDDIAQNTFLKVYSNLNSFENKSAFSTWLYRITVNECYGEIKKRKGMTASLDAGFSNGEENSLKDVLPERNDGTEKMLLSRETQIKVREAILELPEKYRIIVTLRDIEDIPYDEISKIMKISQGKVKVWLFRARAKLKELLKNI